MPRRFAPVLSAGLALALPACTASGDYPSLARRDAERVSGIAEPVAPQPPPPSSAAPPSAQLEARLEGLVGQARAAHARFSGSRQRTERLIAAAGGAPIASESWSVASVALADLESARSNAMVALAELDQLYAAERIEHFESESSVAKAIARARDEVSAMVAEEDAVLARLRGRLAD